MVSCDYFRKISLRKKFILVFSATTIFTVIAVIILIEMEMLIFRNKTLNSLNVLKNQDIRGFAKNNLQAFLISFQVILNSYSNKIR